jgi:hypothetical protein
MTTENTEKLEISEESLEVMRDDQLPKDQVKWRAKHHEVKASLDQAKEELNKTKEEYSKVNSELSSRLAQIEKSQKVSEQKRLEAEIKALALSEGLQDMDMVKLMDLSSVAISDAGDVVGVYEAVSSLKEKKPYLFEKEKRASSSSNVSVGSIKPKAEIQSAWDLPASDWNRVKSMMPS